jgi:hypothetical protein
MIPIFYHNKNSNYDKHNTKDTKDIKQVDMCDVYKEMFLYCLYKKNNTNNYDQLFQSYNLCGNIETKYFQCLRR